MMRPYRKLSLSSSKRIGLALSFLFIFTFTITLAEAQTSNSTDLETLLETANGLFNQKNMMNQSLTMTTF